MIAVPVGESPGVTLWTPIEFDARLGAGAARGATILRLRIFACPQATPDAKAVAANEVVSAPRVALCCTSTATRASPGVRLSVSLDAIEPGGAGMVVEVDAHTTLWIASPSVAIAAWTVLDAPATSHVSTERPALRPVGTLAVGPPMPRSLADATSTTASS